VDALIALGQPALLEGYALAGAVVRAAGTDGEVRRAWAQARDARVVILTPRAARVLGAALDDPHAPLTAVLPS